MWINPNTSPGNAMKAMLILVLWCLISQVCQGAVISLDHVISAMVQIESGGDPTAKGDQGRSWGVLQIKSIYVKDYNRITGQKLRHGDIRNPWVAKKVARVVLTHYGKHDARKHGESFNINSLTYRQISVIVRTHNAGYSNRGCAAAYKHWGKVERELVKRFK